MSDTIIDILARENLPPNPRVTQVCQEISDRHKDRVLAFLYYGSSLRDMDNKIIPPAVYYYEKTHEDGIVSTCKYSIISLKEFEKRCSNKSFLFFRAMMP